METDYISLMHSKPGLFKDIGLYGCLLPIAGIAAVTILLSVSDWFNDKDIWILSWLFRFIAGTIGVALFAFLATWLWSTFKGIIFGFDKSEK